jgi:hypothetical protein
MAEAHGAQATTPHRPGSSIEDQDHTRQQTPSKNAQSEKQTVTSGHNSRALLIEQPRVH